MSKAWPKGQKPGDRGASSSPEDSGMMEGWVTARRASPSCWQQKRCAVGLPVPRALALSSGQEQHYILRGWQRGRASGGILHAPAVTGGSEGTKNVTVLSQTSSALKDHRNMCPAHEAEARKEGMRQEVMFDVFVSNDKNKSDSNVTFFQNRSLFGVGCQCVLGAICKLHRTCVWLKDGFFFFHLFHFVLQRCTCV